MTQTSNYFKISIMSAVLFIIMHSYCYAQNQYNKELLLKTWKLERITLGDSGKLYELIEFKKDSIWERKRGNDKSEGIWYFNAQGLLIMQLTKINGNQNQSSEHKFFCKIKELDSDQLIIIYFDIEGNDNICTYSSYLGN